MMAKKLILLICFVFVISFVSAAAPQNGGFYYNIFNGTCNSAPGGNFTQISVTDIGIEGPCNGFDGTPGWGGFECCMQVCEEYDGYTQNCQLKSNYLQALEQKVGPIDAYVQKHNEQKALETNFQNIITAILLLIVLAVIIYALNKFYFKKKK